jgi:hypothetical protein
VYRRYYQGAIPDGAYDSCCEWLRSVRKVMGGKASQKVFRSKVPQKDFRSKLRLPSSPRAAVTILDDQRVLKQGLDVTLAEARAVEYVRLHTRVPSPRSSTVGRSTPRRASPPTSSTSASTVSP